VGDKLGTGGPFGGLDTDEANPKVIAFLEERGTLVARRDINHSYPHCWRCKHPVIFRATDQWFVSMDVTGLRAEALDAIENQVTWYPAHASKRIGAMVEQRPDWCISRQRAWGVPIPSFTCQTCGEKVMNDATLDAVIALFLEKGSDAWFTDEPASYLGDACTCPACGGHDLKADRDILDVWWDSGVSHTAVLGNRDNLSFPADMYLEGSDQHRGWFQSSLLTSIGAYDVAPYKAVVSQGFTLDGQGRKMSKSLGNVIDPNKVCAEMGADIVRLWVASTDTSNDVAIDNEILKRTSDAYRRFRNTFRFLLSELYDFDPARDAVAVAELEPLDRLALARMCAVHAKVEEAYAGYRFNQVYRTLYDYVVTELSNVYLDAVKDRTYCDAPASRTRRSAQTVLAHMLSMLLRDLQPILAFTCDEVFEYLPASMKDGQPFAALLDWYAAPMSADDAAAGAPAYDAVLAVRDAVTKALEEARTAKLIGKPQEAAVRVEVPAELLALVETSGVDMAELCIVSAAELFATDAEEVSCTVEVAAGDKCPRCWNVRDLGADGLCARCHEALAATGEL
jgi:isoleucyl-tRNA synthetase